MNNLDTDVYKQSACWIGDPTITQ